MHKHKHLSQHERSLIEKHLNERLSFKAIARNLSRDCTTISKEVKNRMQFVKKGAFGSAFNNCKHRFDCTLSKLCAAQTCRHKHCKNCSSCYLHCSEYQRQDCSILETPPYVCNGCKKRYGCTLEKRLYSSSAAWAEYTHILSESRSGFSVSEQEIQRLDSFLTPLLKKGQSIHHICVNHQDSLMISEKTIYNYVDAGLFRARNLDLPRKVRYKPRKVLKGSFKVDRTCRIGRTMKDFTTFLKEHPDLPVVQMDTVEGTSGGKVLLTLHFVQTQFMIAFLRDANTSQSVIDVFETLYLELSSDIFRNLFSVCLTDNGSEFTNPRALEFDQQADQRTRIFYCDPGSPQQKGAIENNHAFIRRILPKGSSFDHLTQEKVNLIMNHINSYSRKNLGDQSPYQVFTSFYGENTIKKLGARLIHPNDITLHPDLIK